MSRTRDDTLRVPIVDDERPARQKVRRFLESDPDIGVIYEVSEGRRAVEVIQDEAPDIVLLDIQMPQWDGFRVLDALPAEAIPHVIFVTAYDQYAIRAFDVSAVDYLLKPFDADRFARALTKAKDAARRQRTNEDLARLQAVLRDLRTHETPRTDRLLVSAGERSVMVRVEQIDRVEADCNYVKILAAGKTYRLRSTITELDRQLASNQFVRVSRSTIVNVDRIVDLEPTGHGDFSMRLTDGSRVRLSRRFRQRLTAVTGFMP